MELHFEINGAVARALDGITWYHGISWLQKDQTLFQHQLKFGFKKCCPPYNESVRGLVPNSSPTVRELASHPWFP